MEYSLEERRETTADCDNRIVDGVKGRRRSGSGAAKIGACGETKSRKAEVRQAAQPAADACIVGLRDIEAYLCACVLLYSVVSCCVIAIVKTDERDDGRREEGEW